jgi:hypothetical protein
MNEGLRNSHYSNCFCLPLETLEQLLFAPARLDIVFVQTVYTEDAGLPVPHPGSSNSGTFSKSVTGMGPNNPCRLQKENGITSPATPFAVFF